MRTQDALDQYEKLYGTSTLDEGTEATPLARAASRLIAANEAREEERRMEGARRDALHGEGQLIDLISTQMKLLEKEALLDNRLPAASKFDAYCIVKDASTATPSDRGLKIAAHALYDAWTRDPQGSFSIGDLARYRDHYMDEHPRSMVASTFNDVLVQRGFQTLRDLPLLTKAASSIVDQESYERAVDDFGLTGSTPQDLIGRAYLKAMAEYVTSDEAYQVRERPNLLSALNRVTARLLQAQENEIDDMAVPESIEEEETEPEDSDGKDEMDMPPEAEFSDESELPHEEMTEEMATIVSPVSGEELVIELGMSDGDEFDGTEPDPMMDSMPTGDDQLPDMESNDGMGAMKQGQMMPPPKPQQAPGGPPAMGNAAPSPQPQQPPMPEPPMPTPAANPGMDADPAEDESIAVITDPTSGQELQVTLTPIEEEAPGMDEEMEDPSAPSMVDEMDSLSMPDTDTPVSDGVASAGGGIPGMGMHANKRADVPPRKFDKLMNTKVPAQPNADPQGGHSSLKEISPKIKDKPGKKAPKDVKAYLNADQVRKLCASVGLTTRSIEHDVINARGVACGEFCIRMGEEDAVEIRRFQADRTVENSKLIRSASLAKFDNMVGDFMALSAAQIAKENRTVTAAKKEPKPADYLITSDVPEGAPINAKRIMASVWKVLPGAEGELLDDGRLSIFAKNAYARDINRVQRVISDVFGVENIEAALVKSAQMSQPQPLSPQTPPNSPYNGATPMPQAPAGQAMPPMSQSLQTMAGGSGAMQNMISQHTDPMQAHAGDGEMNMDKQPCIDCGQMKCSCAPGMKMAARPARMELPEVQHLNKLVEAAVKIGVTVDDATMIVKAHADELAHRMHVAGIEAAAEDVKWRALHQKSAQFAGPESGGDPMQDAQTSFPPPGTQLPGLPMTPGMDGGAGAGGDPSMMGGQPGMPGQQPQMMDASQIPMDINSGQLQPEDQEAVSAAFMHFRNMGMLPLEAIHKFVTAYSAMLDKYGDETAPQRGLAEAAVVRTMSEAYQKPAIISGGTGKKASKRTLKVRATYAQARLMKRLADAFDVKIRKPKDHVSVSKKWETSKFPKIPKVPAQQVQQGTHGDYDVSQGDASSHEWGGLNESPSAQGASQHKQKGENYPDTNMAKGTNGNGGTPTSDGWDAVSRDPKMRSTKRGDLIIKFDPEFAEYHLARDQKLLKVHAGLQTALADAERRAFGTDANVWIDNGDGQLEQP